MIDFLIVGQGLAGTFLHYELSKLNLNCVIIDQPNPKSASQVAAGLINPITGKRLVKSWLFDEAFQHFLKTIDELEQLFSTQYFFQNDIIKPLKSIEEENNWSAKSQDPSYAEFIEVKNKIDFPNFGDCYSFGLIKKGGYLNIKKLLSDYKLFINNDNKFINEYFDHFQINFTLEGVAYKNFIAKGIIFCEGSFCKSKNPFFKNIPFQLAKGEVLLTTNIFDGENFIYKDQYTFVPQDDGKYYWWGSNYDWTSEDDLPSETHFEKMKDELERLNANVQILDHQAAYRPTVKNRRPIMGSHKEYAKLHIFNGLGTKGTLLSPLLAAEMAKYLFDGKLDKYQLIGKYD